MSWVKTVYAVAILRNDGGWLLMQTDIEDWEDAVDATEEWRLKHPDKTVRMVCQLIESAVVTDA